MLSVARNWSFFRESGKRTPTARDYVQDGLIAMWDGIENAGYGVRDQNATVWKDLSGNGYDLTLTSRGATFGPSGLVCPDSVSDTASAANGNFNLATSLQSLEFCCSYTRCTANMNETKDWCYAASFGTFLGWTITFKGGTGNDSGVGLTGHRVRRMDVAFADERFTVSATTSSKGTYALQPSALYYRGVSQNMAGEITIQGSPQDVTHIGGVNDKYPFVGTIHSVRAYYRALTAEEIAANYAIDKERFNLP